MINRIWLQEYGPFRQAEFSLAPITVLVGPNASGKSTAMEALLRVQEFCRSGTGGAKHFFEAFRRKTATEKPYIAYDLDSTIFYFPASESGKEVPIADSRGVAGFGGLPPIKLLKLEPESLRRASYLDANERTIQQNGYGVSTVLADMKLQDDERFEWIESQVRTINPSFERVRFKRAQVSREAGPVAGQEMIFDMKDAPGLSPAVVSDGTIIVLGIVTSIAAMHAMTREREDDPCVLILIDDLERGLHPQALDEFIGCLRRMTQEMKIQIIATSHSPYLLDSLKPEEVRLTGFLKDGSATICELSDHPDFDRWKGVMRPGEIWSTAGEDWIRDVRE